MKRPPRQKNPEAAPPERLQKIMAAAGLGSRRNLEQHIRDGDVLVNGKRRHRAAVIYWLGNGVADGAQGPDISAIPPALSLMGPYASTANCIPVFASMPTAAIAIPYNPATEKEINMAAAIKRIGIAVDIIPTLNPAMIFVAGPVRDCLAIFFTGLVPVAV